MAEETDELELRLAGDIRRVVDEILSNMATLPEEERTEDSPNLLSLFNLMTSVINEDTVLQAAAYVDSKFVRLYVQMPNEDEDSRSKAFLPAAVKEERVSDVPAVPFALSSAEDLFDDEMDFNPNETIIDLDVVKQEAASESGAEIKEEPRSQENMAQIGKHISNKTMPSTEDVKDVLPSNLNLSACSEDELPPADLRRDLRFYEVISSHSQKSVFILPNVNYCPCDFFQKYVLDRRNEFTCAHVLATWLSHALGRTRIVESRSDTLKIIARQYAERTHEFV